MPELAANKLCPGTGKVVTEYSPQYDEAFKGKELERKITSKFYQQLVKVFQQANLAVLINSHHPV